MSRMVWLLVAPALFLVACGGDDETTEECENPVATDVPLTVNTPAGEPAPDLASVTLDGVDCVNNGDGTYDCVAEPDGDWQLAIVDTRYTAFSVFLQLPEPGCQNDPFPYTAQLAGMMGS
jgi:hypothetical protein